MSETDGWHNAPIQCFRSRGGCRGRNGQRGSRGSLLQFQNISAAVCSRFLSGRFFSSRCNGPSVKLEEFKLNEQTELLREMCHLLPGLCAEPQLALRDERPGRRCSNLSGKEGYRQSGPFDGRNQKPNGYLQGIWNRCRRSESPDERSSSGGLIAPEEESDPVITIPPTFFDSAKK